MFSHYSRLLGHGTRRGIVSMILCMALFVANDTLIKLASSEMPTGQIMAVRGVMATALVLALAAGTGALPHIRRSLNGTVLLRAGLDLIASLLYLLALFKMPIGNVTAINMASPLVMTAAAALVLKEPVGWRRWSAVAVGFIGVLMIVQPRAEGFNFYSLVAVASIAFIVSRDLVTRRVDPEIPSIIIVLATSVVVAVGAASLAVVETWSWPSARALALLAAAAVFLIGGYQLIVDAMRHGALSVVGPFRYVALVWALGAGYVVWGDVPNAMAFLGIATVVGSGLYVLHRERVRHAARVAAAAPTR